MARIASLVRSPPPTASGSLAESKLALCELFVASEDARECAQRALDWLGQQTSIRGAICALRDRDEPRLSVEAGLRVPAEALEGFWVDLEDERHPLVSALASLDPTLLPAGTEARRWVPEPLASASCLAVPLPLTTVTGSLVDRA